MVVLQVKNSNNIKEVGSGLRTVVYVRWIEYDIRNKKFKPSLDSNTKLLSHKSRVWLH